MFTLNVDRASHRILSAGIIANSPAGALLVDTLPDGDITDYLFIDGEYFFDPLPDPEQPAPTPSLASRVETVEDKTNELQEAFEMLLSGVTSDE